MTLTQFLDYSEITLPELDYKELYYPYDVEAIKENRIYDFTVMLRQVGMKEPDCRLSDLSNNLWIRTPKGLRYQPYKDAKTMMMAIRRVLKTHGFETFRLIPRD